MQGDQTHQASEEGSKDVHGITTNSFSNCTGRDSIWKAVHQKVFRSYKTFQRDAHECVVKNVGSACVQLFSLVNRVQKFQRRTST